MTEFDIALEEYIDKFDDSFPTVPFIGVEEERVIEIIRECIKNNKNVYEMGYLMLDNNVLY